MFSGRSDKSSGVPVEIAHTENMLSSQVFMDVLLSKTASSQCVPTASGHKLENDTCRSCRSGRWRFLVQLVSPQQVGLKILSNGTNI